MNSEVPMPKAAIARATSGALVRMLWGLAFAGFLLVEAISQLQHRCCQDWKCRLDLAWPDSRLLTAAGFLVASGLCWNYLLQSSL